MTTQAYSRVEVSQPSVRVKNALKSKDYIEFDSPEEGLKWLNE